MLLEILTNRLAPVLVLSIPLISGIQLFLQTKIPTIISLYVTR